MSASLPSWRWSPRACAALIACLPVASGACLHPRARGGPDRSPGPASMQSPAPPSLPQPAAAEAPGAEEAGLASEPIPAGDPVASSDEAAAPDEAQDESEDAGVRVTWSVPSEPDVPLPRETPPLAGDIEQLSVVGHPPTFLSLPTGATSRRPVIVVIHGAGDRPERQCRGWRRLTQGFPFIVCPTGRASPRYTHIGGAPLLEYVDQALGAVEARYPDYVDTSHPLLAGFSLGASQATDLAVRAPSRFRRVALVEGATKVWSSARVSAFLQGGGQRVLFGCGQDGVRDTAERAAKRLTRLGLDVHVVYAPVGHKFAPSLQDAVRSELAWLLEGDDRWPAAP